VELPRLDEGRVEECRLRRNRQLARRQRRHGHRCKPPTLRTVLHRPSFARPATSAGKGRRVGRGMSGHQIIPVGGARRWERSPFLRATAVVRVRCGPTATAFETGMAVGSLATATNERPLPSRIAGQAA
jgi:hypothetical protein